MCCDIFEDFIPDWDDWGIIGPMSQEISDEERERRKIEQDYDLDQEND